MKWYLWPSISLVFSRELFGLADVVRRESPPQIHRSLTCFGLLTWHPQASGWPFLLLESRLNRMTSFLVPLEYLGCFCQRSCWVLAGFFHFIKGLEVMSNYRWHLWYSVMKTMKTTCSLVQGEEVWADLEDSSFNSHSNHQCCDVCLLPERSVWSGELSLTGGT